MGERRALALPHAIALGLLHGPTELLPISSSGHTTLLPWLAGWPYGELDPQSRKTFEVALHAGTAFALLVRPPWRNGSSHPTQGSSHPSGPNQGTGWPRIAPRLRFLVPAMLPPALAGYKLGGQIEQRLGTPVTIAAGLLAGSAAILAAELHPRAGGRAAGLCATCPTRARVGHDGIGDSRPVADAGPRDGLALGLAQAVALFPGVSRSGASLSAARARGFSRVVADRLSWDAGLPVIAGAASLKGVRLVREGSPPSGLLGALIAGGASSFLSTLLSSRVLTARRRVRLLPACVVYRVALALLVIRQGILRRSRLNS